MPVVGVVRLLLLVAISGTRRALRIAVVALLGSGKGSVAFMRFREA